MPTVLPSRAAALLLVLCLALGPGPAAAPAGAAGDDVLVAVLDTGLDPSHPEIDMARVVAWWDFGSPDHAKPAAGETWDPRTPVPFDTNGHGTAVASLVAGATLGTFPGARLAVARLDDGDGHIVRADEAIRWAASLGADVVVMSFGTIVPLPGVLDTTDEAVRLLHDSGGLPVVAAGNGLGNAGVRSPSTLDSPAGSPYALVVGATGATPTFTHALFSNTDPDVVAFGVDVCVAKATGTTMARTNVACKGGDARYGRASGTSFSAPLVAGWSAKALQAARDAGKSPSADDVRTAIMHTARDTVSPYAFEGFGVVDAATAADARAWLVLGATPPPNTAANAQAHALARGVRKAWTEETDGATGLYLAKGSSTPRSIDRSTPATRDAELWTLPLAAGERVRIDVSFAGALVDLDAALYRPGSGPFVGSGDVLVAGTSSGAAPERLDLSAPTTGTYLLAVEGWLAPGPVPYTLTVTVDGSTVEPTFLGDHVFVGARVLA